MTDEVCILYNHVLSLLNMMLWLWFQILLEYKNIGILYLHGNEIQDLKQIEKLAALPNLKKLTLHGNPIAEKKVLYIHLSLDDYNWIFKVHNINPYIPVAAKIARTILVIQANLDMTDHCTTDFCIWRTICLVSVRCISSIRHIYIRLILHMTDQFSWSHWVCHIQVHLDRIKFERDLFI